MSLLGNTSSLLGRADRQLRYLSQSALIEEAATPHTVRLTMLVICSAAIAFLGWASVTEVNEVARANGEVVPDGYVRAIQHLEGGIVSEIRVREGNLVNAGDPLILLTGSGTNEDLQELKARQLSLGLQAERLRAFVNDRLPDFTSVAVGDPSLVAEQKDIYQGMLAAREAERRVIERQIAQKREELAISFEKRKGLVKNTRLAREARNIEMDMVRKGVSSQLTYLDRQERLVKLEGQLAEIDAELIRARQEIEEYENRLLSMSAQRRDDAYQALHKIEGEMAQNRETLVKLQDRVDRLEIRAPVSGLVTGLQVSTIGAVTAPGQTLLEIVPNNEALVVEARISPADVGHTEVGQRVQVKVSAYDYARYGAIEGTLQSISATTFAAKDGQRFYLGRIKLAQTHVGPDPSRNLILPGMLVEADIITGGKSILAYLLKPIHVSLSSAFIER